VCVSLFFFFKESLPLHICIQEVLNRCSIGNNISLICVQHDCIHTYIHTYIQVVLDGCLTGDNVFFSGMGGTGKVCCMCICIWIFAYICIY